GNTMGNTMIVSLTELIRAMPKDSRNRTQILVLSTPLGYNSNMTSIQQHRGGSGMGIHLLNG
ncbi:hypothetical protein, partial [Salinibacterium sp.]|uniref:hypothetical protein n=1 Tax=Salinibacterium sp. TaxID=1915057 RepID=UPI00286A93DC